MKLVSELMTRPVVTLKETDNLGRIDELLQRQRIRHLPVVRGEQLVGLVTHRDLLRALAHRGEDGRRDALWAVDFMQREVATVRPETPLREALSLMLRNKYGCLPVVDARGALAGILTESDLLRYCHELLAEVDLREEAAEYR
jgi:CBS domain-containing protein